MQPAHDEFNPLRQELANAAANFHGHEGQTGQSVKKIARVGGLLYLIIICAGFFGEIFVRQKLVVSADPMKTAMNILSSEQLWRIGIAGDLLQHVCDAGVMVVLYLLLKPVNRHLALAALILNIISSASLVAMKLNQIQALFPLAKQHYLDAFTVEQLNTLSYFSIRSDAYGFGVGLIFFGFECVVLGYLIFKSLYFPRIIGILVMAAGICYVVNSFTLIVSPKLASVLAPAILVPSLIGELTFCLWLIFKGVNMEKWPYPNATSSSIMVANPIMPPIVE